MFKELWERPNLVLRYGSFDPTKSAEALARAGELGAVVRALTSEGVLEAKDHTDKLKGASSTRRSPHGSRQAGSQRRHPNHHAPFTSADFMFAVKKARLNRAADALGWKGRHHQADELRGSECHLQAV